jgi:TPR repeat protein
MRPYVRPLVVTFSALALACLFSYAAIALTEPSAAKEEPKKSQTKDHDAIAKEMFVKAKAAAASGDPAKLVSLANLYLWGIGTEPSEVEAAKLHRLGAEKNDPRCMYLYGSDLRLAIGVKEDKAAGLALIRKAAEKGFPEAEYKMHELLEEGDELKADPAEARRWLLLAAEHGEYDARADLAVEILSQKDKSRFKSLMNWVKKGAEDGHGRSAFIMAFIYQLGLGVTADPVESMAWRMVALNRDEDLDPERYVEDYEALSEEQQARAEKRAKELCGIRTYESPFARDPAELAAERKHFDETMAKAKTGDAEARYELSRLFYVGEGTKKDKDESNRWCLMAAEQGLAKAQCMWGLTLLNGDGVTPDAKQAAEWFRKSATQGHPRSEFILGMFYRDGTGMKADPAESTKWLTLAAEHGYADAQYELGNELYGEKADSAKDAIAARWFRKSAEQLQPNGCFSLGRCYLNGRGLVRNKIEGLAWMLIRAEKLGKESKEELTRTLGEFGEDEIKRASERSQQLQAELEAKLEAK